MFWLFVKALRIRSFLLIICGLTIIAIVLGQGKVSVSQEVGKVARQITVRIEGAENGSGVLIGKQGNIYYALTAKHVVRYPDNYAVVTPDGSVHPVNDVDIRRINEVDLAIMGFTSEREYMIAEVGDSDLASETTSVWVAGFPLPGRENRSPIFHITNGQITARPLIPNSDGYALTYSNITRAGMSGGPVLNAQGHLLGIHGLSEAESSVGEKGITVPIPGWTNLGIPIKIFRTVAPLMNIKLALADPSLAKGSEQSNCIEQLRFRNILTTEKADDEGLWEYPVTVIGSKSEKASLFGPGDLPGRSMEAVGCRIKRKGFLGSKVIWRCPESNLRVEMMSVAQAQAQCDGRAQHNPTPMASRRREEVRQKDDHKELLASKCRPLRADHNYWKDQQFQCFFEKNCRSTAKAGQQEAERKWISAGCDAGDWGPIWGNFDIE